MILSVPPSDQTVPEGRPALATGIWVTTSLLQCSALASDAVMPDPAIMAPTKVPVLLPLPPRIADRSALAALL